METLLTTPKLKLIVGLGNPGPRYQETRHNAGFLVLDELAKRRGVSFKKARGFFRKSLAEECKLGDVLLIKPMTFMNLSGQAVQSYQTKLRLKPEQILVVHDDLDLPLGRLRLKTGGGGAGGQNGVKDTINRIGNDFLRLKIGIDRPPKNWAVSNWVLSKFKEEEKDLLAKVIEAAEDALELVLVEGLEAAMKDVNGLDLRS